jgi:hypothetical protein
MIAFLKEAAKDAQLKNSIDKGIMNVYNQYSITNSLDT